MLKICESAVGGILVIDEMYSLAGKGENDFGTEALETLLKFMEDNRDKIVVIGCGYTKEMQNLIDTNSGLRSRFSNFIDFENYTPEQCLQILDKMISKYNIKISDDKQRKVLLDFFGTADNDSNFANARAVRNLQEYIIAIQSTRLGAKLDSNSDNESEEKSDSSSKSVTKKELTTINLSDINEAIERYFSINHKISNGEING
jgi:SpoVK/Ycf46/Vps4 family AAA+-type ATPase